MKIGFCGTMSVGKTTLVNALKELPEFKDYNFRTERSKYLMELGIPLNTDSTVKGQTVFLAERASELIQENIITDSVSQYKFYQGFIQEKGTSNSITKLFDALSSTDSDSVELYEEWAIRLGQYGSIENIAEIEYQLTENNYKLDKFIYEIDKELLKGEVVEILSKVDKDKTDKYFFSEGFFDFKNKSHQAKETKIKIHKNVFENEMLKHFIIVEEMANPSAHGLKYFKSFENN